MTGNYYCYIEGESTIYTISSSIPSAISFNLEEMKETTTSEETEENNTTSTEETT